MKKDDRKVVPLPGLDRQLVNKGIQSMDNGDFVDSEGYFREALRLKSEEPQAHFGWVLSLFELGKVSEARAHCEKMLAEGIGEYYDILDPYITILVQMEEYEQIAGLIEAVLQEHSVPANLAERLYQVLDFCRHKITETNDMEDESGISENDGFQFSQERKAFEEDTFAWEGPGPRTSPLMEGELEKCQEFLNEKESNPYDKSMILQLLKDKHVEETVSVYKFGKKLEVDLKNMNDITDDALFISVKQRLVQTLEQENPSLHKMAVQLWHHFVHAMFPILILPSNAQVWAGAVYQMVHIMNGMDASGKKTANLYQVSEEELNDATSQLTTVEDGTIY